MGKRHLKVAESMKMSMDIKERLSKLCPYLIRSMAICDCIYGQIKLQGLVAMPHFLEKQGKIEKFKRKMILTKVFCSRVSLL